MRLDILGRESLTAPHKPFLMRGSLTAFPPRRTLVKVLVAALGRQRQPASAEDG
jgi:hypothetical protein